MEELFAYSVTHRPTDYSLEWGSVKTIFVCCESESSARTFRLDKREWTNDESSLVVRCIGPADKSLKRGIFHYTLAI